MLPFSPCWDLFLPSKASLNPEEANESRSFCWFPWSSWFWWFCVEKHIGFIKVLQYMSFWMQIALEIHTLVYFFKNQVMWYIRLMITRTYSNSLLTNISSLTQTMSNIIFVKGANVLLLYTATASFPKGVNMSKLWILRYFNIQISEPYLWFWNWWF